MFKRIGADVSDSGTRVKISDASFPSPFESGLEYGCSARGTWNIVHTGMLMPQAHEIFVCASGCLRGVVLTAAEMGASHRFSTVEIREQNVLDGDMEELIVEGVSDILSKLTPKPKAVLLYTSCIHHFIGCDLPDVYRTLRERHPDVDFTDCYMNPIMRKSGITPDALMRKQLYSLLPQSEKDERAVNIIGNNIAVSKNSELYEICEKAGFTLTEIHDTKTYEQYKAMGKAFLNITTTPAAVKAGEQLQKRLSQKHLPLMQSFNPEDIKQSLTTLCKELDAEIPDLDAMQKKAQNALSHARELIGDTPITIDYTAVTSPLSLARLLLENGFNVKAVYADSFTQNEKKHFDFLKMHYPELDVIATVHSKLRVLPRVTAFKTLAIGQKAAYFTGTEHFVNIVESGGMYGFSGIVEMCSLMEQAFVEKKDTRKLIQIKGMGCSCE